MNDLSEFYDFLIERQQIYIRKELEEQDKPWTEDEVLQKYHFCNVHREFDSGTRFYIDEVCNTNDPEILFLRTIIYRILNNPDSFKDIESHIKGTRTNIHKIVNILRNRSETVFSSAYRIGGPNWTNYEGKIGQMFYGTIRDNIIKNPDIIFKIMYAPSMEEAHEKLMTINGIGEFFAYEVVIDLNYLWFDFTENDFVSVGPGAKQGLNILSVPGENYEDQLRFIWSIQSKYTEDLWLPDHKDHLTLRDIEHTLCEYSKYVRASENKGSVRLYK